jgi:hypothetical protein
VVRPGHRLLNRINMLFEIPISLQYDTFKVTRPVQHLSICKKCDLFASFEAEKSTCLTRVDVVLFSSIMNRVDISLAEHIAVNLILSKGSDLLHN